MTPIEKMIEKLGFEEAWREVAKALSIGIERAFQDSHVFMCIQPHIDDTDVAAGGTIAKLTEEGKKVIYVTMTDGRLGTNDPNLWPEKLAAIRRKEQEKAAKILGVSELVWLNYRDSELTPSLKAREELIHLVRKYRPDMIITVDPWLTYEAHPDHVATGILASQAALFASFPHVVPADLREGLEPHQVKFIAYYWTRKPNTYIDVSGYIQKKLEAVKAHESQFKFAWPQFENLLKVYSSLMGKKIGVKYAEAFKVLTPAHLHSNIFSEDI